MIFFMIDLLYGYFFKLPFSGTVRIKINSDTKVWKNRVLIMDTGATSADIEVKAGDCISFYWNNTARMAVPVAYTVGGIYIKENLACINYLCSWQNGFPTDWTF